MKKEVIIFGLIFLLSISFISAFSWSDLLSSGISGNAVDETCVQKYLDDTCSGFGVIRERACRNSELRRQQGEKTCVVEEEKETEEKEEFFGGNFEVADEDKIVEGPNVEIRKGDGLYNVRVNQMITATNNISVMLTSIYSIFDSVGDKGISLNFYTKSGEANSVVLNYILVQENNYLQENIYLSDFGVEISINKSNIPGRDEYIPIKIKSLTHEEIVDCKQLYDYCLKHIRYQPTIHDGIIWCLRECGSIENINDNYVTARDGKFLIIANKNEFSQESVNAILNYTEFLYNHTRNYFNIDPVINSQFAVFVIPYGEYSSTMKSNGILIHATNDPQSYDECEWKYFTTDLTHESVHFFTMEGARILGFLLEGHASYGTQLMYDYILKKENISCNGDNNFYYNVDCGEKQICESVRLPHSTSNVCSNYTWDTSVNGQYTTGACFFRDLNETYPDLYKEINDDIINNRLISQRAGQIYCIGDKIKLGMSNSDYLKFKEKYMFDELKENFIGHNESLCSKSRVGDTFGDYWYAPELYKNISDEIIETSVQIDPEDLQPTRPTLIKRIRNFFRR